MDVTHTVRKEWKMQRFCSAAMGIVALAAGLGLIAPRPAEAQGRPSPFTLRLGVAFPVGDTEESAVFALGGEFNLPMQSSPTGPQYSVSLDWFKVKTDYVLFENEIDLFPLLFNARWVKPVAGGKSFDYGLGLGILFAEDDAILETDDIGFGWQAFLGYQFNPKWRGDLRFVSGDHPGDNGFFLLQIGYRI
jgi:hypothetical protein